MPSKVDATLCWLVIGVGILLRFIDLPFPDFATDEAQAALGSTAAWTPLGMEIMAFAQNLFGHSILVARSVSAVFGVALLPLLYFLAREYTDKKTALLVTAIAAIFPTHIVFSRLAYLSTQLIFGWTLTLYCFLKARQTKSAYWYVGLLLAGIFATLIKAQGLLLPGLLLLGSLIEEWRRSQKFSILHSPLSITLALSLLPTAFYIATHPGIAATVLLYGGNMYGVSGFFHRFVELFTTWWAELSLFLVVLVSSLLCLRNMSWPLLALLALVSTVGFILGPDHAYYVSDLVLFALPIGFMLSRAHPIVRRSTLGVLLGLTLVILGPVSLYRTPWTYPLYQEEGYWNTHADALNAILAEEETVTVLGFPGHHLRWYLEPTILVGRDMTPPYPTAFTLVPRGTDFDTIAGETVYNDEEFTIVRQR